MTVFIGDFISISYNKATGETDVAGAANSITTVNAVATTAAVASVDVYLGAIGAPKVAASTITTDQLKYLWGKKNI